MTKLPWQRVGKRANYEGCVHYTSHTTELHTTESNLRKYLDVKYKTMECFTRFFLGILVYRRNKTAWT